MSILREQDVHTTNLFLSRSVGPEVVRRALACALTLPEYRIEISDGDTPFSWDPVIVVNCMMVPRESREYPLWLEVFVADRRWTIAEVQAFADAFDMDIVADDQSGSTYYAAVPGASPFVVENTRDAEIQDEIALTPESRERISRLHAA